MPVLFIFTSTSELILLNNHYVLLTILLKTRSKFSSRQCLRCGIVQPLLTHNHQLGEHSCSLLILWPYLCCRVSITTRVLLSLSLSLSYSINGHGALSLSDHYSSPSSTYGLNRVQCVVLQCFSLLAFLPSRFRLLFSWCSRDHVSFSSTAPATNSEFLCIYNEDQYTNYSPLRT